jgi:hypothetical protein
VARLGPKSSSGPLCVSLSSGRPPTAERSTGGTLPTGTGERSVYPRGDANPTPEPPEIPSGSLLGAILRGLARPDRVLDRGLGSLKAEYAEGLTQLEKA